jgi:hypothetical protein
MNKTILLIIGGVAVVGIAAIMLWLNASENKSGVQDRPSAVTPGPQEEIEERRTLSDFLFGSAMTEGMKCEVTAPVGESLLTVTTYIAGERVAVHYYLDPPIQGQDNLHMVADRQYGYVWGDSYLGNNMKGMKIDLTQQAEESDDDYAEQAPIDYDMPLDHCEPWQPDGKTFELPDGLEFQTMEEMFGGINLGEIEPDSDASLNGNGEAMMNDPCDTCEMLPADQQAQCLEALGCN